ncbi:MAG: hypothetical protein AB7O65_05165 [Candidatus Korobacteraceae bacterium]
MKRGFAFTIPVLLLALSASGQRIRGTPASVTSFGGNRTFVGGVPASVTSISPALPFGVPRTFQRGVGSPCAPGMLIPSAMGCGTSFGQTYGQSFGAGVRFSQHFDQRSRNFDRRFNRRGGFQGAVPVIVPYAYPYATYADYDEYGVQQPGQPPVQIEIKIVDDEDDGSENYLIEQENEGEILVRRQRSPRRSERRSELAEAVSVQREAEAREPEPQREVIPTILIFRDGRRQEVRNYAIMGKVLYDFEAAGSRRIQLAELDVSATVKENEDRGIDFAVPRGMQ